MPALACDSHAHALGPQHRYAYTADRSYTPPDALLDQYLALHRKLGIERGVLVQPSVYGTVNQALVDALELLEGRYRGIAVADPDVDVYVDVDVDVDVDDADAELHRAGVRGVRVNRLFKGGISFTAVEALAYRIQPLGWHIQALLDVSEFNNLYQRPDSLPVDVVIDYQGHMSTDKGLNHTGFQALLKLLDTDIAGSNSPVPTASPPKPTRPMAMSFHSRVP
ncbi:MAG: 2-pyrone-4,6-dicarboxylate lactonase [Motiliproteus sp.]|jgi:2-pyrone-4,6-dicarboxylate lactonase